MPEFSYSDLLPLGQDGTNYRRLSSDGVTNHSSFGRNFLEIEPQLLTDLTAAAMHDIAHLLRPAHLSQLRSILDDPEASPNDRYVARDLLKNACIAAGGVLPMCQDTGTAIVMGKRGQHVLTDGRDEEHISRGVYDAYTTLNLRYSQLAPLTMWEEKNTGSNLPAQVEIYATGGSEYKFLFMAKGGGSANKSFLYQETKAVLNPARMASFLEEKIRSLGTAACPPYHLAIVVGGTSAEFALKTAKYASAKYLDTLPSQGSASAHGFRDRELEEQVLGITRRIGIGAQFGGKYFCHDVRVIRLPRHGASCPVAIAVSCSADRQALGKITADGVFLEQLETDPAQYLPDIETGEGEGDVVAIDLNRPMAEIRAELSQVPGTHPRVADRAAGGGAGHRPRQDRRTARRGRAHARLPARSPGLLRRARQDAGRLRVRVVRADHRGADGLLRRPVPGGGRVDGHAGQGEPFGRGDRRLQAVRRVLPRLDRRRGGAAGPGLHHPGRGARVPRARHGSRLEDRGPRLPRVHRGRRQGQRLLRRPVRPGTADRGAPVTAPKGRGPAAKGSRASGLEHDSMGEVEVPAEALWGAQTQRAVENFPVSGERIGRDMIGALGCIKGAAARINAELGVLDADMADAIHDAAAAVARGEHDDQFPVDVFQTGSGTSSNMNANEVIAALASRQLGPGHRPVHPNDHVNASQSSNDVFPSAIDLAATRLIVLELIPALDHLAAAFEAKAAEFASVVKVGRTHLMDAVPVTLGQEFGGYAAAVRHDAERVGEILPRLGELPLGGTAVGTGLNAPPGFASRVISRLASSMGLPLTEARNHFEAAGGRDALVEASGVLRVIAVSLYKICNDLRWMGSGPRAGLGEISIPDLQPGSSIMPGKVNPVICEAVCQVCTQVIGNDAAVAFGGAAGNFELNVMMPVIGRNLLASARLLTAVVPLLADRCVSGITAHADHMQRLAGSSPVIVTALNSYIGYEAAAQVAHEALATGETIRSIVISRGYVSRGEITEAQLDAALDLLAMTGTGDETAQSTHSDQT